MKQNKETARRAKLTAAVIGLRAEMGGQHIEHERDDIVADLLADLRHYCDAHGLDFADLDRRAYGNYTAEKAGL